MPQRSLFSRYWLGAALLALGLLANPWTMKLLSRSRSLAPDTVGWFLELDLVLILLGALALRFRLNPVKIARMLRDRGRGWGVVLVALSTVLFNVLFLRYFLPMAGSLSFPTTSMLLWCAVVEKVLLDFGVLLLLGYVVSQVPYLRWLFPPVLFLNFLVGAVNLFIIVYAQQAMHSALLDNLDFQVVFAYMRVHIVLTVTITFYSALALMAALYSMPAFSGGRPRWCWKYLAVLAFTLAAGAMGPFSRAVMAWVPDHDLGYSHDSPHLFKHCLDEYTGNAMLAMIADGLTQMSAWRVVSRWEPYRATIKRYELPIGHRRYSPLSQQGSQPERVVLIFNEGISTDLMYGYNPQVKHNFTPRFFSSDSVREGMYTNCRASTYPTHEGVTASLTSHPNAKLSTHYDFPTSMVKVLKAGGYSTHFLNCCHRNFDSAGMVCPAHGFDHCYFAEDYMQDEGLKQYVSGWGLNNRKLLGKAADLLEANRGKRLFVVILLVDTHEPGGRVGRTFQGDYGDLRYPEQPAGYEGADQNIKDLMASYFRNDYDHRWFMDELSRRGLYDHKTLVVVTSDHQYLSFKVVRDQFYPDAGASPTARAPRREIDLRIPLVFLTPRPLPAVDRQALVSQVDIAPTVLHLLGLPVPEGYWGESIFHKGRRELAVGYFRKTLHLVYPTRALAVPVHQPEHDAEQRLVELFNTIITPSSP